MQNFKNTAIKMFCGFRYFFINVYFKILKVIKMYLITFEKVIESN